MASKQRYLKSADNTCADVVQVAKQVSNEQYRENTAIRSFHGAAALENHLMMQSDSMQLELTSSAMPTKSWQT
eukprot:4054633-Pleurochrysis_carterae.AAC.4